MNFLILLNGFLLMLFVLPVDVLLAQDDKNSLPDSNAEVVASQISLLLKQSVIIGQIQKPFQLTSTFPDQYMDTIYQGLMDDGKQVSLTSTIPKIQIRLFPNNSIRQLDKQTFERVLSGELHILLTGEDSILEQSETLQFTYSDVLDKKFLDEVESSWQGGAFQIRDMHKEKNLWKRAGQPAIIAVATGVTVFLLFNIRSN